MRSGEYSAELSLVIATVEQAVRDIVRGSNRDRSSAQRWVNSEAEGPFSFLWCCNILGINPEAARGALEHEIGDIRKRLGRVRGQPRAINNTDED